MWWWSGEAVPLGGREGVEWYVCAASDAGQRVDDDGLCVWVVAGGSGGVVGRDNWEQERAAGLAGCKFRFGCWRGTGSVGLGEQLRNRLWLRSARRQ